MKARNIIYPRRAETTGKGSQTIEQELKLHQDNVLSQQTR